MDHREIIPESHPDQSIVPENRPMEEFLDEPETDEAETTRRPLHLENLSSDEDSQASNSGHDYDVDRVAKLPRMLQLLFGLNGLSLSLLTLPIMYILNTRVEVPLPYMPAYGAIAFLPYSLKPMYAFLCGMWVTRFSSDGRNYRSNANSNDAVTMDNFQNNNKKQNHQYLSLFRWLLATNSIFTLLLVCIPKGGVLAMFVVAFLRGISDSWAEFCLNLTLIDHARANVAFQYEPTVSSLQAQAATSGNLGAWLGSLLICVVLLWRRVATSHNDGDEQPQLTWALANGLVIFTALAQLVGVAAVYIWERKQCSTNVSSVGIYEEIPVQAVDNGSGGVYNIPTESDSLRDEESSHPSYSSLEDLSDEEASLSTEGSDLIRSSNSNDNNRSILPRKIANWAIVILLQCVLVVLALKGPIIEVTSHFVWAALVWTFLAGIFIASITLCCKLGNTQSNNASNDLTTFKVGLFLVLKNAIPSETAILASFFYSLFGINQPLLMQFLSFLGMGVSSLSSWSYTRLFSTKFGSGRPLVTLMAGTTALASLASLLHISVFRIYQEDGESDADGDDTTLPSRKLLLMAVLSKFVTTFFDEWAFLPELVLATTSVKVPATSEQVNASEAGIMSENPIVSNTPSHHDSSQNASNVDENDQQRIAMEYGTLVSCLDFGDQLGSLLAVPLVAAWQISRENGFLHLDRLIVFCSVANVAVTIGLLPLLWNIGSKSKP